MRKVTMPEMGAAIFDQHKIPMPAPNSWGGPDGNTFMLGGMGQQGRGRPGLLAGTGFRPRDFRPGGRALNPGADLTGIPPQLLQALGLFGIAAPTPTKVTPFPRPGLFGR